LVKKGVVSVDDHPTNINGTIYYAVDYWDEEVIDSIEEAA